MGPHPWLSKTSGCWTTSSTSDTRHSRRRRRPRQNKGEQPIARNDSPVAAHHVLGKIEEVVTTLSEFPERSTYPRELSLPGIREYREILYQPNRILYRASKPTVHIYLIAGGWLARHGSVAQCSNPCIRAYLGRGFKLETVNPLIQQQWLLYKCKYLNLLHKFKPMRWWQTTESAWDGAGRGR